MGPPATGPRQRPVPTPTQPLTPAAPAAAPPAASGALQKGETVRVETDVFVADIDTAGGDLRRLELLAHRDTLDHKKNFVLLQQQGEHTYVAQSGLIGNNLPNHRTRYTASERDVKLAAGADRVSVRLAAPLADGLKVTKVYTFHRGSYVIDVGYEVENKSATAIQPDAYFQLVRDSQPPAGDSAMLPTYTGMAVYTDKEKFQKVAFTDVDKGKISYPKKSNDGWIALLQHYFLSAWLPANNAPREFYTQRLDNGLYAAGVILSLGTIEPGASRLFDGAAVCWTAGAGQARQARAGARSHRRLWLADRDCQTAVLVSAVAASLGRQLGGGDHHSDRDHQSGVLSVVGGKLSLDGAHAHTCAADAEAEGAIRQRSPAHEPGDDGTYTRPKRSTRSAVVCL